MRLPNTRNRILSLAIIFLLAAFCFGIYTLITGRLTITLLYLLVGLAYLSLYFLFPRRELLLTMLLAGFYLTHTFVELRIGLNFDFLLEAGFQHNSQRTNRPGVLVLIFVDIARYFYPIFRYALVLIFFYELIEDRWQTVRSRKT